MPKEEIRDLWAAFTSGEEQAFSRLYQVFYPQLYRYGLKLSHNEEFVKDVIQDTFFYLYEKKENLANEVVSVQAYLFTSFRRNLLRKNQEIKREQFHREEEASRSDLQFTIGAEDILIDGESGKTNKQLIVKSLNELPPRQREILYLKYYHGQTTGEIAETLGISYQTVANQLYRALSKLRNNHQIRGIYR